MMLLMLQVIWSASSLCQTTESHTLDVCTSPDCIEAAGRLSSSINLTADPCHDFYNFACGKFEQESVIPEDKSKLTRFTPLTDLIFARGQALLEEPHVQGQDWPVFKKVKDYYESCMNLNRLEEKGLKPMKDLLQQMGGWPVLEGDKWDEVNTNYTWFDHVYKMTRLGISSSFIFHVNDKVDVKNSSVRIISIDQPSLGINREYLIKNFNHPVVQHYLNFMNMSALLFGADPERVKAEMVEVLRLEMELANATSPREDRRDVSKLYKLFTFSNLTSSQGHPPSWHSYVNNVFEFIKVDPDDQVVVNDLKYVTDVSKILSRASPRVLANYLGWRSVQSLMRFLNKEARDIEHDFKAVLSGVATLPPRAETCARVVGFNSRSLDNLRIPAAALYVKRFFPKEAKETILEMIGNLKEAFRLNIQELDWMDDETKSKALDKLNMTKEFIGYPDEILDQAILEELYKDLTVDSDDFLGSYLRIISLNRKFIQGRLREVVDKNDWFDHSLVILVNAFYSLSMNSIQFPAGILQGPFFNHKLPKALNYGGIGIVIGHEITHGFDDRGRHFDAFGNLHDWWAKDTASKFVSMSQCIIDQYSNFHDTQVNLNLNGVVTQGENIADNGGIQLAYRAYVKWLDQVGGNEPVLPGHPFDPRQLFWINIGLSWCSKYRDAELRRYILTKNHPPNKYRVLGPLSNNPDFAADFKCPVGSKMNPVDKCSVW